MTSAPADESSSLQTIRLPTAASFKFKLDSENDFPLVPIQTCVIKEGKHEGVSISGDGTPFSSWGVGWLPDWIFSENLAQYRARRRNNPPHCFCRYDPKTDTWTTVSSLSVPRDAVGVCLLGDRLYAVGGYDGQSYLNTVESYDAQNNDWTEVNTSWGPYLVVCTDTSQQPLGASVCWIVSVFYRYSSVFLYCLCNPLICMEWNGILFLKWASDERLRVNLSVFL